MLMGNKMTIIIQLGGTLFSDTAIFIHLQLLLGPVNSRFYTLKESQNPLFLLSR